MNLAELSKMTEEEAREYLENIRWPNGTVCAHCGSKNVTKLNNKASGARKKRAGLYKCKDCRKQFTVTCKTIFESSRIPIRKWIMAYHLMCSSKKGISALQLSRNLGLVYKSAWFMCHRIRHAMVQEPLKNLLQGGVEVDETYVGGKPRKYSGRQSKRGRGTTKIPVVVLVQRNGEARVKVMRKLTGKNLKGAILNNVHKDSTIYTDEYNAYKGIGKHFTGGHKAVMHSIGQYKKEDAHTNTAECYFSLLKRGVIGAFHHVSEFHLPKYCNEFNFRWNYRRINDGTRTIIALKQVEGKRLHYKEPLKKAS